MIPRESKESHGFNRGRTSIFFIDKLIEGNPLATKLGDKVSKLGVPGIVAAIPLFMAGPPIMIALLLYVSLRWLINKEPKKILNKILLSIRDALSGRKL